MLEVEYLEPGMSTICTKGHGAQPDGSGGWKIDPDLNVRDSDELDDDEG